jgi:SAM-dependent methyltransferase
MVVPFVKDSCRRSDPTYHATEPTRMAGTGWPSGVEVCPMLAKAAATGRLFILFALMAPALNAQTAQSSSPDAKLDVSYEPTPQLVVDAMLKLAKVGPDDLLIDLGCGDGRIPVTAAKVYGTSGLGVDLDPERIWEARANAEKQGVVDKVSLVEGDLFTTDLDKASVITLFLYPDLNLKLRPRLLDLMPGTRIVSHAHDMGSWRPDAERMLIGSGVCLWVVPAKIDGNWRLGAGDLAMDVELRQSYQLFFGTAVVDGRRHPVRNGRIDGTKVSFTVAIAGERLRRFTGSVTPAGQMEGTGWRAQRKVHDTCGTLDPDPVEVVQARAIRR